MMYIHKYVTKILFINIQSAVKKVIFRISVLLITLKQALFDMNILNFTCYPLF